MPVLEQIFEEIEGISYPSEGIGCGLEDIEITDRYEAAAYGWGEAIGRIEEIIRSHMKDDEMDIDAGDNEWIPAAICLPENAKHMGAFCPKYEVLTKYGKTIGWYNPDTESWYVLIWFMSNRCLESEIDFERGDVPKTVRAPLETKIVTAWKPYYTPEPYRPKEEQPVKGTLDNCRLIKKYGQPRQQDGKCAGFQKSEIDDEPCETCKECKRNEFYEED